MNCDVIILGGGPAGIAAAITLSEAGVSTILIEKCFYPRDKTCAGILTEKTISFLMERLSFPKKKYAFTSNQIALTYQRTNKAQCSVQFPFTFVERQSFDYDLLKICKKKGTKIIEGVTVTKQYPSKNTVILSNHQSITYKCLIVAEGVFSPTRKQLGLTNIPCAFCIQDTIRRELCPDPLLNLQQIQLNFGDIPFGYSWIVPYSEHISIGSGAFLEQSDYSALLLQHNMFCEYAGLTSPVKRRGAFVPIGGFGNQTEHSYENIIFIGDSAGLANPLTGEGIYHALLSGFYAGKSYLSNPQKFRTTYLSFIQPMIDQLAEQKTLISQFYDQMLLETIFLQFKDCTEYLSEICDEVISSETKSYYALFAELQLLLR